MPRVPSQKLNHPSTATAHPYAISNNSDTSQSVPSSSVSGAHSPHSQQQQQQHRLKNSQPHMSALHPSHNFDREQHQYREGDLGSRLKQHQMSPHGTPHIQAQTLNGKLVVNQGNHQAMVGQDVLVKAVRNGTSSTEPSRGPPNGNAPPVASTSGSPSTAAGTSGSSAGVSGGLAQKKKHVCPTCDRAFTTSGHLARHARVHTGERNHKCPFPGCETRCSRQDNLQQHYRIHLSPGSRRSSSSATRAAIQRACAKPNGTAAVANPPDLDSPPPLAQATFPAVHLAQSHVQYAVVQQPYPPASTLSQTHVSASHVAQHSYHPQTPPVSNAHVYENGNTSSNGISADASQGYGRGDPDSPAEHSGPASATPSADTSPVISANPSVPPAPHPYPTQQQTYIYVQHHPGYYAHAHPSQASGASTAVYSTPPPSSGLDGQYPSQPQISTFYQQHHYPREAYIASTQGPTAPSTQAPPSYVTQNSDSQHTHDQGYTEPPKTKMKRRGRSSDASVANGEQSPSDSPIIANAQDHTSSRPNGQGQGQSNVYAYYGMAAPSSAGSTTAPPTSASTASGPSSSSVHAHSNARYSVNGNGFGQFQLHTPPPPPPPLTSSSTVTTASSISYAPTPVSYSSQNVEMNGSSANGNGTDSPPPVLAPIQQKRPSYHESLPSRYSYVQHSNTPGYASVGKDYSE